MTSSPESDHSIIVTFADGEQFPVPPDQMLSKDYLEGPILVSNIFQKPAHTIACGWHAVITVDAMWNNDAIFDGRATQYYIYPHRNVDETCKLLGLERSEIPIESIIFQTQ